MGIHNPPHFTLTSMDESEVLIQSPQLLLRDITDPDFLRDICAPFYGDHIAADSFTVDFARNVIVPRARAHILSRDPATLQQVPTLVKLLVDNLHEDGLNLVTMEIFTAFEPLISSSNFSKRTAIVDTICETISHVSSRYRDRILVQMVSIYASKAESNFRVLAVHLIPLVRKPQRVLSQFTALSLDRVAAVRQAVARRLCDCAFDGADLRRTLSALLRDAAPSVRSAAAANFARVAPERADEYSALLRDPALAKAALKGMKAMVAEHGLAPLLSAFRDAMRLEPETAAIVILNISRVVRAGELPLVLECAAELRDRAVFIRHLRKFSLVFADARAVLPLLDPAGLTQWRHRFLLVAQLVEFAPVLGRELAGFALALARDPVAAVRSESVKLWAELVAGNGECAEDAKALTGTYQERIVLCKIVGACGVAPHFADTAAALAADAVSNVRLCLARQVRGTEWFERLFEDAEDIEIELNCE